MYLLPIQRSLERYINKLEASSFYLYVYTSFYANGLQLEVVCPPENILAMSREILNGVGGNYWCLVGKCQGYCYILTTYIYHSTPGPPPPNCLAQNVNRAEVVKLCSLYIFQKVKI